MQSDTVPHEPQIRESAGPGQTNAPLCEYSLPPPSFLRNPALMLSLDDRLFK